MVGGESLSQRLNTHVRSQTAKRALAGASRYAATGHVAMLNLVLSTDPLALTKDEKELTYVLEELGKLKDADATSELWQDYYESWASFLSLRSNLKAECAQQIFDAMEWAEEEATPVDTAKDGEQDTLDETVWAAHKQTWLDKGAPEKMVATLVDMQQMDAM